MHDATPAIGPRCAVHGSPMPGGRACPLCLTAPVADDEDEVGFYEAATEQAQAAGLPDRIGAERILWERHAATMAIADACAEEARHAEDARTRATFVSLQLKAIETAGKDARHAATMILWRERCADAEKADRLYRDQQRKVGKVRH